MSFNVCLRVVKCRRLALTLRMHVYLCCRLALNRSGGQCWNEEGSRVHHWSWGSVSLTPTALHPVFLSLNKAVGVRVLGREQVFVSFLARGQQARFRVGPCCVQVLSLQFSLCLCFLKHSCTHLYFSCISIMYLVLHYP